MNLLRPSLLLAVCLLALMGAAAASAQAPLTASFDSVPDAPEAGQVVTFIDTTKNPGTAPPLERAWDLDGDGEYDDSTDATPSRAYDAGDHDVALRVRRLGTTTQTSVARKTIHVRAAASSTPTPAPTVSAPKLNLPPVARLARQCVPLGTGSFCQGAYVKLDHAKTFDASGSTDAEGPIVRHQWDVDGNGTFDADTGADPHLTYTYRDEAPATLRLRVTDGDGATGETEMALTKLEADCQDYMSYARVYVSAPCLREYDITHTQPLMLPNGKFSTTHGMTGHQYRSKLPVTVNGVTIAPTNGKLVLINVLGAGLLRKLEVVSASAVATFPFKGENLLLQDGALRWKLEDNELRHVGSLDGRTLNGLKIAGAPDRLALPARGVSRTTVYLKLPDAFGAVSSDKPLELTAGSPRADLTGAVAKAAAADDAFSFSVPNAAIGPIGLDTLKVSYDGDGLWEIEANVQVPVVDARVTAKAGILDGDFNYAGAEVSFGSPGLGPLGPIYIQRIKFRVEVNPKRSECVPHVGVEDQYLFGNKIGSIDYGVPTFALCGEVGLTGGPRVLGTSAIALDAGLGLATYDDRPSVLRAFGSLKVVSVPFADATFEAHTDGFLKVAGSFHYGWDGFASVSGHLELGVLGKKFNAEGGVKACLDFVDWCRGVNALISSRGIAVCMVIDYGLDDWRPGFGYEWGDSLPTPYFSGCSLGPYREKIKRGKASAASVEERSVTLPAGLPGTVIAATGQDAPPKITLVGPKGERVSSPDDLMPVEAKPFLLMKNPQAKLTQVAISKPSAGRWRVIVEDGSSPVTSLKVAHAVEPPKLEATVTGTGHARRLRYAVEQRPGQTVTFIERGASTSGMIGTATAAHGELAFSPAAGAAEQRQIVALVEQDGLAGEQPVVARYRAPGVRKPASVKGLRTRRGRGTLAVSWAPDRDRHVVSVALSDGRKVVRVVRGRSLVVRGVGRSVRARVSVRAVGVSGVLGRTARVRVR